MTSSSEPHLVLVWTWFIISTCLHVVDSCNFPSSMVMARDDPPWYSHVMDDGTREFKYYVRQNYLQIHFSNSNDHVRWKCMIAKDNDKLMLRREDHRGNKFYKCARFHQRSPSIVQVEWSEESRSLELDYCEDDRLHLDPWPIVNYKSLHSDYDPCPFSGGYDLKITDSQLGESGCNLMLRPMRMEVECLGGEGVTFDFMSNNCKPDIKMHSKQKTVCMASWLHNGDHFTILRKTHDTQLWCLSVPVNRGTKVKAYLFSDLVCLGKNTMESNEQSEEPVDSLKYFILDLQQRNFPSLCEDEYSDCSTIECNDYFKQECKKSCDACSGTSLVKSCTFPKRFKGPWLLKSPDTLWHVDMKETSITIQGNGRFQCASFPDSPLRKSRIFSTVSVFDNGCRPRFTCVKLKRLGPSVISYSLSQSHVWPSVKENFGAEICDPERFQADAAPVGDLYRPHAGSGKPIVSDTSNPVHVKCNLSAVHTLSATLPEGFVCSGSMFTHCEDPTKLRLDFASCSGLIDTSTDYRCLANYEGHYWERILLVQNLHDQMDIKCFVFNNFKPNEAFVMVASECDQKAFNFARAGVRKPLLSLKFREEAESCRSVPTTTMPTTTYRNEWRFPSDGRHLSSGHSSIYSNRTHADQGHLHQPIPIDVTVSQSMKNDRQKTRDATKASSRSKTDYNLDESQGKTGNGVRRWEVNRELLAFLIYICFFHSVS